MRAELLKGHLEGMILAVLELGPMHGYPIIGELQRRSGGEICPPTGTIYPALRRMESAGLVRGTWSQVDGRRRRTYELTQAGRDALGEQRREWREIAAVISTVLGDEKAVRA
ncbi:PadR family transcriptional regulator [Actinomadura kijaniata]|uniref:PadR family transcriptional regulator n=1 Tax=Actinomadura kijaniata TaxID=46161 RepID=UPI003F1B51DF